MTLRSLALALSLAGCVTEPPTLDDHAQDLQSAPIHSALPPAVLGAAAEPALAIVLPGGGTAQSQQVMSDFEAPLVVYVLDTFGNPLEGVAVQFTAPGSGATALLSDVPLTDADGRTSVEVMAGPVAGVYTVDATVAGAAPIPFVLRNVAGDPAVVLPVRGTGQRAPIASTFDEPLVVQVLDTFGNAVTGAEVSFTSPEGGPRAQLDRAIVSTDTDGEASVIATAGELTGTYIVHASIAGVASVAFVLSNTAQPAGTLGSPRAAIEDLRTRTP